MSVNSVTVSGNTTRDIEIRSTAGGMVVASFGIAVNERVRNGNTGEWEDRPNFFDVVGFGQRWEKLEPYIPKGTKVAISGKLRYSSWEKDGQKRSKVEIVADDVELMSARGQGQTGQQSRQAQTAPYGASQSLYDDDIPFS